MQQYGKKKQENESLSVSLEESEHNTNVKRCKREKNFKMRILRVEDRKEQNEKSPQKRDLRLNVEVRYGPQQRYIPIFHFYIIHFSFSFFFFFACFLSCLWMSICVPCLFYSTSAARAQPSCFPLRQIAARLYHYAEPSSQVYLAHVMSAVRCPPPSSPIPAYSLLQPTHPRSLLPTPIPAKDFKLNSCPIPLNNHPSFFPRQRKLMRHGDVLNRHW